MSQPTLSFLPPLCLAARQSTNQTFADSVPQEIIGRMMRVRLARVSSPDEFLWEAVTMLRRGFHLEFGAAYGVLPARPLHLTLLATEGLPPEFDASARTLPLPDYADIADLPFSAAHGGCWGDFFAPLAAAHGMAAWLFSSVARPSGGDVRGSLLLGSRNSARFGAADTVPLFALARLLSQQLDAQIYAP